MVGQIGRDNPTMTSLEVMKAFRDQRHVNISRNAIAWYLECRIPLNKRRRAPRRKQAAAWAVAAE
jgi:hypothetical protein